MTSNEKDRGEQEAASNVGERRRERRRAEDVARIIRTLALDVGSAPASEQDLGSDPYNTSGGFDRKKNWTRVGKR
jgi:hypothetical protein